jgi:hypothetical protein
VEQGIEGVETGQDFRAAGPKTGFNFSFCYGDVCARFAGSASSKA